MTIGWMEREVMPYKLFECPVHSSSHHHQPELCRVGAVSAIIPVTELGPRGLLSSVRTRSPGTVIPINANCPKRQQCISAPGRPPRPLRHSTSWYNTAKNQITFGGPAPVFSAPLQLWDKETWFNLAVALACLVRQYHWPKGRVMKRGNIEI